MRDWLTGQSLEAQREYGEDALKYYSGELDNFETWNRYLRHRGRDDEQIL